MVCTMKVLRKCSVKHIIGILISASACGFIHFCFVQDIAGFLGNLTKVVSKARQQREAMSRVRDDIKYILLWTPDMKYMQPISERDCSVSSCTITQNRGLLNGDYARFDAIIFSEKYLKEAKDKPIRRATSQIYIFASAESASNYPSCELHNDDFFNWTFTYRLDSDILWNFFVVRNISGEIVAPSKTVQWSKTEEYPVHDNIKVNFQGRKMAAAWIVSNCRADSLRDEYLSKLQEHLFHYSLQIDVYGECTGRECKNNDCNEMLRANYYFYMAFENSFAVDYVTGKVLRGYGNYVVPIVYGGANYSWFLPPGSYINARDFHPYNLAYIIFTAVQHAAIYEEFFKWTNFYSIHPVSNTYHLCGLCKAISRKSVQYALAKKKFRIWWNTLDGMKWCLPQAYWNETSRSNIDGSDIYKKIYGRF